MSTFTQQALSFVRWHLSLRQEACLTFNDPGCYCSTSDGIDAIRSSAAVQMSCILRIGFVIPNEAASAWEST